MYRNVDDATIVSVVEQIRNGRSVRSITREYGIARETLKSRAGKLNLFIPEWKDSYLTEPLCAWVAAVIDCEGILTAHSPFNKQTQHFNIQLFARVQMVNTELPKRLQEVCGGSYRTHPNKNSTRMASYWNITANGLRWLLPQIMPYLIVKKRHAEIILEILQKNGRGVRMDRRKLYELMDELHALNFKGFPGRKNRPM